MFKHCEKKGVLMKKEPYASSAKLSVTSVACRICYDNDKGEELVAPCYCKGTVAYVHRSCLEAWVAESGTTNCELCHQMYRTDKAPKGNFFQAFWNWLKNGSRSPEQGVRVHIIACTVITPLAIILVTYIVCMYYNQRLASTTSSPRDIDRNSSVSLLTVLGIILIGYYLWVYSVTRLHAKWQRSCLIRYIPRNVPEDQIVLVPDLVTQNRDAQNTLRDLFTEDEVLNQDGRILTEGSDFCAVRVNTYTGAETSQFDINIVDISPNKNSFETNMVGEKHVITNVALDKTEIGSMRSGTNKFDNNHFVTTDVAIVVGDNLHAQNIKKEQDGVGDPSTTCKP